MASRDLSTTLFLTKAGMAKVNGAWSRLERENEDLLVGFGDEATATEPGWINVETQGRRGDEGRTIPARLDKHVRHVNAVIALVGRSNILEVAPNRRGLTK